MTQFDPFNAKLNQAEFNKLSHFVETNCGIKMPAAKKNMVEGRLRKRLKALSFSSYKDYLEYVFNEEKDGTEMTHMIDALTTNKTDFFREEIHFDYLTSKAIPSLQQHNTYSVHNPFRIWSAACSTGEEPYTMAIVLAEHMENNRGPSYQIFATDISTKVLSTAQKAVYEEEKVDVIPLNIKRKYLLRNKDRSKSMVRIVPELRRQVSFHQLNFMDDSYGWPVMMDVIFCRNALIYFEKEIQENVLKKQVRHLKKGGFLFIGHSETLQGMNLPLRSVAPTIYQRT